MRHSSRGTLYASTMNGWLFRTATRLCVSFMSSFEQKEATYFCYCYCCCYCSSYCCCCCYCCRFSCSQWVDKCNEMQTRRIEEITMMKHVIIQQLPIVFVCVSICVWVNVWVCVRILPSVLFRLLHSELDERKEGDCCGIPMQCLCHLPWKYVHSKDDNFHIKCLQRGRVVGVLSSKS